MMAPEYEKACGQLEPYARFVKVDTGMQRLLKEIGPRSIGFKS